jgi:hypothetical protein
MELISATPDGGYSDGGGTYNAISADGRYVAFISDSTDLVAGHGDGIYVRDRVTQTTQFIDGWATSCGSVQGDICGVGGLALSGNGRYLVFTSASTNLVPNDTNGCADTFVRDLVTGTTERVSVASDDSEQVAVAYHRCSYDSPKISYDGRYVGFSSAAVGLVPGITQRDPTIGGPILHPYVRDRLTGTTSIVEPNTIDEETSLEGISDDGRYVTYTCNCGDPVPAVSGRADIVTVWVDRDTGVSKIVGDQANGIPAIDQNTGYFTFGYSFNGLAADGLHVAFESWGSNIVPGDTNDVSDVFIETLG